MRSTWLISSIALVLLAQFAAAGIADEVTVESADSGGERTFALANECIRLSIEFQDGLLSREILEGREQWLAQYGGGSLRLGIEPVVFGELMWTGWRAPGKAGNADNKILLFYHDFVFDSHEFADLAGGGKRCDLSFKAVDGSLELRLSYSLSPGDFFARRVVAIRDPEDHGHFLMSLSPLGGLVEHELELIKAGGFGQPVALAAERGGAFFGIEYPAADNNFVVREGVGDELVCSQEMGVRLGEEWTASAPAVCGLAPEARVKHWFWKYVDAIRVAPLRPYLLYNSWYDVRSPEYTERPEDVMNEANVLRIANDFKREMVEKRGLKLDAFVLDDGWDIYESDWVLRPNEFPGGLKPVSDALAEMGTDLGIWLGPIGGYSFRDKRVDWMQEHGYETVGDQLCLAGENYKALFRKRTVGFVRDHGVRYFKWDGIQFSCSEPGHGHPPGEFSRRAVMESVIELCRAVRAESPDVFLNITSGTWLSPWWVKYANMIWMQGHDYGYADVPSISRRDAAITYRDFVLHEDFCKEDFWFPLANLMTHGIIKGHLQKLGGEAEPLDKFTDNALLYFARGVSMWELYISPNLLSEGEWDALAKSIRWARDRFEILRHTEKIGGDPGEREAYGYVHFEGGRGIVAARNPFIEPQALTLHLLPEFGLDADTASLVVEKVYPVRSVSPRLHRTGESLELALGGYETAVYEIYPLAEATEPLLAGATFERVPAEEGGYAVSVFEAEGGARLLNPEVVVEVEFAGKAHAAADFTVPDLQPGRPLNRAAVGAASGSDGQAFEVSFELTDAAEGGVLAVLLETAEKNVGGPDPEIRVALDSKVIEPRLEKQEGRWCWYQVDVEPGEHTAVFTFADSSNPGRWRGKVSAWLICDIKPPAGVVTFRLKQAAKERPMPPSPWPAGHVRKTKKLGSLDF